MQNSKGIISPLLYFTLISSLTNLVFLIIGMVGLALFSAKLSGLGLLIIVFLLVWKGALVGFVSWFSHKKANNKGFLVKFIGIYLGRFFGIIIGGFLGYEVAETLKQSNLIGFVIGALAFYFAGRWLGSKISTLIGAQLDSVLSIPESQATGNIADAKSTSRFASMGFILYGVALPFLLVIIGLLMNYFEVPIGYLPELLPVSRIVVIVCSVLSISAPWLLKSRWISKYQTMTSSPESVIYWLGLVFSIVPAIYGFVLFLAMGTSIVELCFYSVVSSIATIIWSMNNKVTLKPKAG
ncbi:MAG: hypothetical protein ACOYYF_04405 [Chloroflexota bacterium]|nr:hypothetical protein [Chloroflexota bacterium]MBI5701912.1 hypothetical protein [Chloroflexota bacterium]